MLKRLILLIALGCFFGNVANALDSNAFLNDMQLTHPDVEYKSEVSQGVHSIYIKSENFNSFASNATFAELKDGNYSIALDDVIIQNSYGKTLKARKLYFEGQPQDLYELFSRTSLSKISSCGHSATTQIIDYAFFDSGSDLPFLYGSYVGFVSAVSKPSELECGIEYTYGIRDLFYTDKEKGYISKIKSLNGLSSENETKLELMNLEVGTLSGKTMTPIISGDKITFSSEEDSLLLNEKFITFFNSMTMNEMGLSDLLKSPSIDKLDLFKSNLLFENFILNSNFVFSDNGYLLAHYKGEYVTIDGFLKNVNDEKNNTFDLSINASKLGSLRVQINYENINGGELRGNYSNFYYFPLILHNFKIKYSDLGLNRYIKILNNGKGPEHGKGLLLTLSDLLGEKGLQVPDSRIASILDWVGESKLGNVTFFELNSKNGYALDSLISLFHMDEESIHNNFTMSQ